MWFYNRYQKDEKNFETKDSSPDYFLKLKKEPRLDVKRLNKCYLYIERTELIYLFISFRGGPRGSGTNVCKRTTG